MMDPLHQVIWADRVNIIFSIIIFIIIIKIIIDINIIKGAEKCRWEDGFIMSDLRHTERGFRWSPCTIQSFHHFLK